MKTCTNRKTGVVSRKSHTRKAQARSVSYQMTSLQNQRSYVQHEDLREQPVAAPAVAAAVAERKLIKSERATAARSVVSDELAAEHMSVSQK